MDETDMQILETDKSENAIKVLTRFIDKNKETFIFKQLDENNRRQRLWDVIFTQLEKEDECLCHKYCLICVRILSREKEGLDDLINQNRLDTLLHLAGLRSEQEAISGGSQPSKDYDVMLEALKSLCNIVYNSSRAQELSTENHSVEGVVMRMRMYRDESIPTVLKYFDMKLLFLITALCSSVRPLLQGPLHGHTYLIESLDLILQESDGKSLSEEQMQLVCEILKVLFNLAVEKNETEEESHCLRLVSMLQQLLLVSTQRSTYDLHQHVVNLLMTIPGSYYSELMSPADKSCPPQLEFEGNNMEAVAVLLGLLDEKLGQQKRREQPEALIAILTALTEGAKCQRPIRKFLRARVLPPLAEEVLLRPEEGDTLRNRLCQLLTAASPIGGASELAADFIFVLCKENVARMVKYTGYGNAAGLLANRGLLLGGERNTGAFSSDSEDSDTEEYKQYWHSVNPVTGCYEPPKPDPTAGMTEEQKEYEAMQLVNMMDRLTRDGVVQPCKVGGDGRPQPVDHVLQLLEELPKQQLHNKP